MLLPESVKLSPCACSLFFLYFLSDFLYFLSAASSSSAAAGNLERKDRKLLYLAGTIPVVYKEYQYNIPVCIWLHETHPISRPRCCVRPSVSMVINPSCPFVDAQGVLSLPYLSNWTQGVSNLTRLIAEMTMAFQKVTPIYARIPPTSGGQGDPVRLGPKVNASSSTVTVHCPPDASQPSQQPPGKHRTGLDCVTPRLGTQNRSQSLQSRTPGLRRSYAEELQGIDFSPSPILKPSSHPRSSPSSKPSPFSSPFSSPSSQPMPPADVNLLLSKLQLNPGSGNPSPGSGHPSPGSGHPSPGSGHPSPGSGHPSPGSGHPSPGSGHPSPGSGHPSPGSGHPSPGSGHPSPGSGHPSPGSGRQTPGRSRRTPGGEHLTTGSGHLTKQPELAQVLLRGRLPAEKAAVFWHLMTLPGQDFKPLEVLEAVQHNKDLASALKYLSHTCPICQEQVTFSKIVTMTHCQCALCASCFKAYFTTAIKERTVDKLVCPLCSRPDIRGKQGMGDAMDYFNLLDTQIRHFLDAQSHELFQKKLRDRALQDMPNFRWCANCSFGMLHEADRLRMDCPNCRKSTCSQCRSPWIPEHQGVSCDDFKRWQQHHDPAKLQALELDSAFLRNKIECPNCRLVFYLSKGGCLHFSCSQCQHEFCGGCSRPFTLGSGCVFSKDCASRGLHAHHPRNCLYHLRDWSVARLRMLLQCYQVSPAWLSPDPTGPPQSASAGVCLVMEVPDDSSREEPCGRPALPEHTGVCGLHHKERLVEVVRQARLDPATLYRRAELEAELQRWCVAVPPRADQEAEHHYVHRLRTTLAQNIPLQNDSSASSSSLSSSSLSSSQPSTQQPGVSSSSSSSRNSGPAGP
ncbi:unnamed protein product [Merluccius merluccius]